MFNEIFYIHRTFEDENTKVEQQRVEVWRKKNDTRNYNLDLGRKEETVGRLSLRNSYLPWSHWDSPSSFSFCDGNTLG